jgi:hypothetical protein
MMRKTGVAVVIILASLLGGCCAVFNYCPEPSHETPADAKAALKEIKWQISKSEMAVKYARKTFRNYSGGQLTERKQKLERLYAHAEVNGNMYLSTVKASFGEPVFKDSNLMPAAEAVVDSVQELYNFAHSDVMAAGNPDNYASTGAPGEHASESLAEAGVVIFKANRELRSGYFNMMYEILNHMSWKKFSEL